MFGICHLSLVPCRKEPSHRSEMVTQLLFGEHFSIQEEQEEWIRIITAYDQYECWISNKQYLPLKPTTFEQLQQAPPALSADLMQLIRQTGDDTFIPLVMGSTLPFLSGKKVQLESAAYEFSGEYLVMGSSPSRRDNIIKTAYMYLNAPYLWGGKSFLGIDCSGFTQMVYKLNHVKLPRDAYQQAELGEALSFVEEAQPGDLAFFDNEEGRIIHVGIVLENNHIIHASGKVRVDKFDHYGIFNGDTKRYSHHLRVLKRLP